MAPVVAGLYGLKGVNYVSQTPDFHENSSLELCHWFLCLFVLLQASSSVAITACIVCNTVAV